MNDWYGEQFTKQMNQFQEGLAEHPELIPELDTTIQKAVLYYLLELACWATHIRNITLGRQAIWAIPHDWLINNIEVTAKPLLKLNDDWVNLRLIELYWHIGIPLVRKLALYGLNSENPEIKEAATDCLERINRDKLQDCEGFPGFEYYEESKVE